jgi:2-oxoglutarate dehydrogenase E1 component
MIQTALSLEANMSNTSEFPSYLHGQNAQYLADLYAKFLEDPSSVDTSWAGVFQNLDEGAKALLEEAVQVERKPVTVVTVGDQSQALADATRAAMLIRSYQVRGHLLANLDPLNMEKRAYQKELDPKTWGFTENDYNRTIFLGGALHREFIPAPSVLSLCIFRIQSKKIGSAITSRI